MKTTCGGSARFDEKRASRILCAASSENKVAWTYTHYKQWGVVKRLNQATPATVNVSCNSDQEALKAFKRGLPVTVVRDQKEPLEIVDGVRFVRCPAQYKKEVNCQSCGNGKPLCANK